MTKLPFHWQRNTKISAPLLLYATGRPFTHPRRILILVGSRDILNGSKSSSPLNSINGIFNMVSRFLNPQLFLRCVLNVLCIVVQAKCEQCLHKTRLTVSTWTAFSTITLCLLYLGFMTLARSVMKKRRKLFLLNHSKLPALKFNM